MLRGDHTQKLKEKGPSVADPWMPCCMKAQLPACLRNGMLAYVEDQIRSL